MAIATSKVNTEAWARKCALAYATITKRAACIFRFPRGHWGFATGNSDIAKTIRETGEIYPGTPGTNIEWIEPDTSGRVA